MHLGFALVSLGLFASQLRAQDHLITLRGSVISVSAPVSGANVFLLETLDGALTDSAGKFSFTTTRAGSATLVVKAIGFGETRRVIELPIGTPITVVLKKGAHS